MVCTCCYKIQLSNIDRSGVKIYEYLPGFIHGKTFIVDDKFATVGTINLDYRSLYLHFECGVWLYNMNSVFEVKEDFLQTQKLSQEITLKMCQSVPWYIRLGRSVLRIFCTNVIKREAFRPPFFLPFFFFSVMFYNRK